ncbi:MAG: hypothetical protein RSB88_06005, partial [Akkermansia sp.]
MFVCLFLFADTFPSPEAKASISGAGVWGCLDKAGGEFQTEWLGSASFSKSSLDAGDEVTQAFPRRT